MQRIPGLLLSIVSILLLVAVSSPILAAADARAALVGFDEFLAQAVEDYNVPGLAMAVVAGGEVVFAEGFGYRDVESAKPMTADSLFAIGSTTKAMTVTVLGMLADEGKFEWDEPLTLYLPEFRLADPMITARITPRDLVTHRSGLPRHDLLWYNNNESTRAEIIERMRYLELTADLRETFQYNNLMFMTAGYFAGQLTDATWEETMRARLFEPLGMKRSNFNVHDSEQDADHALPYREDDDDALERIPFRDISMIGPAGSVNSSVNEMAQWLLFNLRGGKVGDEQLVNASTLAEIHSPQMTTGATQDRPDISPATYGMGWGIVSYRGHARVSHGGGIDGFVTSVMFFPNDDLGIVAFDNRGSGLASIVSNHAADRILGLEAEDWMGEALDNRKKAKESAAEAEAKSEGLRITGTNPSHGLDDYIGEYAHPGYGVLRIERAGEQLALHYNGIAAPLEHWHYDVWNGAESEADKTFEDQKLLFTMNVDGLIAGVESLLEATAEPIRFEKRPDSRLSDPGYLERFVGAYETATGSFRVELAGTELSVLLPGQPPFAMDADLSGRFVWRRARTVSLGFEQDDRGNVVGATIYRPGGATDAKRVETE